MKLSGLFTSAMLLFSNMTNVTSQSLCIGDIDNNRLIDVNDLLLVISRFSEDGYLVEDIDDSGLVDVRDILIILSQFGLACDGNVPTCVMGSPCGGQVWYDCGTSCPLICGSPEPMMCNMMCNKGYQCPQSKWWSDDTLGCVDGRLCVTTLPPGIAIGRPFISKDETMLSESVQVLNDWSDIV
jgi:hypothetical protein